MSQKLTRFLIELSEDPVRRQRFESDPEGAMAAAGLSAVDKELVLARDAGRLRAHFGVKALAHMTCIEDSPTTIEELLPCLMKLQEKVENLEERVEKLERAAKKPKRPAKKRGRR
jgi:hypothetical protein